MCANPYVMHLPFIHGSAWLKKYICIYIFLNLQRNSQVCTSFSRKWICWKYIQANLKTSIQWTLLPLPWPILIGNRQVNCNSQSCEILNGHWTLIFTGMLSCQKREMTLPSTIISWILYRRQGDKFFFFAVQELSTGLQDMIRFCHVEYDLNLWKLVTG